MRRGSSTDEAAPDEVLKMGNSSASHEKPSLDVSFADRNSEEFLGKFVTIRAGLLKYDPSHIPRYGQPPSFLQVSMEQDNDHFYRQYAEYEKQSLKIEGFRLGVRNTGSTLLSNVKVKITGELCPDFIFQDSPPKRPKFRINSIGEIGEFNLRSQLVKRRSLTLHKKRDSVACTFEMLDIQPGAEEVSEDLLYLGGSATKTYKLRATVFADNLSEPQTFVLTANVETRDLTLDVETFLKRLQRTAP